MSRVAGAIGGGVSGAVAAAAWFDPDTKANITFAWTFFVGLVDKGPLGMWAALAGVLMGWLTMLWIRAIWPPNVQPDAPAKTLEGRRLVIWVAGLAGSLLPTYLIWPTPFGGTMGVILGLAAPWSWEIVLLLVGMCSPSIAEKLRGTPQ